MRRIGLFLVASALAITTVLAGTASARPQADPLTIYAAASLTEAFRALDPAQRYSFAGSNALETQIRQGAPADIFASAAPVNTQNLFRAGLVQKPVTFTANRLALIVPKSNPAGIHSVYDLRTKPVKLVIAAPAVPVGGYTRTVLRKMGLSSVLSKVVSQESDVKAVTGKVALGQADAGFVYVTDARPVSDQVTVVRIPAWAQPRVRYEIAIVSRSTNKAAAQAVDQDTARRQGPERAQERRLPPAAQAGAIAAGVFRATLVLATSVALAFLLLPVAAIFLRVPPGDLLAALRTDAAVDAIRVTLETNAISMVLIIAFGTPTAYWVATRSSRFRDLVVTLIELPLVLPPAVAGIGLLAAFGNLGLLGGTMEFLGIDIAFTKIAVVLAVTFVASPFYVRTAVSAFETIEPTLPDAARTLGAGPAKVFVRIALPLAAGGLGAGAALAFARGIGEFGATIMFAGSLQGVTQTLSLAIYEQFDLDFDVALAISAVLVAVSAGLLLTVKLFSRWRSNSTSPIPFAPS